MTSIDPFVWSQIQNEALHVGALMQHLSSMLLELGRIIMMLCMGRSSEFVVNVGCEVYICSFEPNPIMVKLFCQ